MTLLVTRADTAMTPQLVGEMRAQLPQSAGPVA
jgi:hypothetical protein